MEELACLTAPFHSWIKKKQLSSDCATETHQGSPTSVQWTSEDSRISIFKQLAAGKEKLTQTVGMF